MVTTLPWLPWYHRQQEARVLWVQLVHDGQDGATAQVASHGADRQDDGSDTREGGEMREGAQQHHAHTGRQQSDEQTALHPPHVPVQVLVEPGEEQGAAEQTAVGAKCQVSGTVWSVQVHLVVHLKKNMVFVKKYFKKVSF